MTINNNLGIKSTIENGIGFIWLDRPDALNAINQEMVHSLLTVLTQWRTDSQVHSVVLQSTSPRAFCAGGDVKLVYHAMQAGNFLETQTFYQTEYQVNQILSSYPKPVISIGHGIVMGGGMGLVMHSRYRIATETSTWAMPETAIGFFPDVGAIWFFKHCPKLTGYLMALSCYRARPADCVYTGLATHYMDAKSREIFFQGLIQADTRENTSGIIDILLENFASNPAEESTLEYYSDKVDECFSHSSLEAVMTALEKAGYEAETRHEKDWFHSIDTMMRQNSPLSMVVTFEYLKKFRNKSLQDVFTMDRLLAGRLIKNGDFMEGVRAKLIDKCQAPKWLHANISDVSSQDVAAFMDFTG